MIVAGVIPRGRLIAVADNVRSMISCRIALEEPAKYESLKKLLLLVTKNKNPLHGVAFLTHYSYLSLKSDSQI